MIDIEEVKKILDEPVTCEDGRSHYIDESNKRYLASQICRLFEPKLEETLTEKDIIPVPETEEEREKLGWHRID